MAPKRFIPINITYKPKRGHHGRLRDSKGLFLKNTTPKPVVREIGVYPKGYRYKERNKDGTYTGKMATVPAGTIEKDPEIDEYQPPKS